MRALALAMAALPAAALAAEFTLSAPRPGAPPLQLRAESRDGAWQVAVLDPRGGLRQRIKVRTDVPEAPPRLADADGDGAADLWLPVVAGTANLGFDLWRMRPGEARFVRAGELSGTGFARDPAGFLVALGRNGCCAVEYVFHRFGADGALTPAFTIGRRFGPDVPAKEACTLAPAGTAVPRDTARRYCALGIDSPLPGQVLDVP